MPWARTLVFAVHDAVHIRPAIAGIGRVATVEIVVPRAAMKAITTSITKKDVASIIAKERVRSVVAQQNVLVGPAVDAVAYARLLVIGVIVWIKIGGTASGDPVVTFSAINDI